MKDPDWLEWARELQAMAQIGLTFCRDPYDRERYEAIRQLAARMFAARTNAPVERIEALFAGETGYATPKVDVRAAVFDDDDRILMVRETSDGGRWTRRLGRRELDRRKAPPRKRSKKAASRSSRSNSRRSGTARNRARSARLLLLQILLPRRTDRWPRGDQPRDLGGRLVSRGEHPCRLVVRACRNRSDACSPTAATHLCRPISTEFGDKDPPRNPNRRSRRRRPTP